MDSCIPPSIARACHVLLPVIGSSSSFYSFLYCTHKSYHARFTTARYAQNKARRMHLQLRASKWSIYGFAYVSAKECALVELDAKLVPGHLAYTLLEIVFEASLVGISFPHQGRRRSSGKVAEPV